MSIVATHEPIVTALPSHTLSDLTDLPRVGFRGRDSAQALQASGFSLPDRPNRSVTQEDGSQVISLSASEYLLLGSPRDHGLRIADEEARWELDHQANYLLPRQDSHAWLQLSGERVPEVMAKICGVDLRPQAFGPGSVAQTSAARINVIVINPQVAEIATFHILFDRASLSYFRGALLDALAEFGVQG